MEVCVRVSGAVCRDEQACAVKIRRIHRHELDLHRPLAQLARHRNERDRLIDRGAFHTPCHAARASGVRLRFCLHIGLHGGFVISGGFALDERDGAGRADRQAVAEAVAVVVAEQSGFAVHHADSALVAGVGAQAAAVAFFFVDFDNFANHSVFSLYILFLVLRWFRWGQRGAAYPAGAQEGRHQWFPLSCESPLS